MHSLRIVPPNSNLSLSDECLHKQFILQNQQQNRDNAEKADDDGQRIHRAGKAGVTAQLPGECGGGRGDGTESQQRQGLTGLQIQGKQEKAAQGNQHGNSIANRQDFYNGVNLTAEIF